MSFDVGMVLDATDAQLESEITRTPENIRLRYRENRHWSLYQKEWIYRNIPLQGKDVLDFGCGTGEIATQLAFLGANKIYALDVDHGLLEATRRRAELDDVADRIETVKGPIGNVEPRQVDVIIAYAVLHHCFPLENLMPYLLRWLKPGGVFVAREPVSYSATLEWLRNHSGVPKGPLDEGERKLQLADVQYLKSNFSSSQTVNFYLLDRLSRVWPKADRLYRRLDRFILRLPGVWKLSGDTLIVGRR
ncbi:MAG: class I SAM-dependent methyltransferase [Candidatus Micrarchaeaceae archaeon]